ncbi:MAG TPA: peptidoglycan recognition family protein [Actinomycetota bacterium]
MPRRPLFARDAFLRALAAVVATLSLVAGGQPPAAGTRAGSVVAVSSLKPTIVQDPIPYGAKRRRQMAAYSDRHYGERTWHLTAPEVIVEHYTDGTTYAGAWNTFAANGTHNGEKPGTCTHFIVDRDGTIYQLVPLWVRCRHAVGMNHTSIGIEHVGTSDRMVLGNDRQMRASLRLTAWLMARFDVNIGHVEGHRETLESTERLELYPSWQCLVHADFPHAAMKEYRTRLKQRLWALGLPLGPGPTWVNTYGC